MMASRSSHARQRLIALGERRGASPFARHVAVTWNSSCCKQSGVVIQGAFLSFLQVTILAAAAVSFSAFFPNVVSVAATTLVFILGNVSSYMVASVENLKVGPLTFLGRLGSYLIPNLGYFNLQMYFSEGKIISFRYLSMSFAYTALYVVAVFLVSCSLFRKREVR
jgi:hypothetical protein